MELVTRGFELVTRRTLTFEFQFVLLSFQPVTRNSQLVTRVLPYHDAVMKKEPKIHPGNEPLPDLNVYDDWLQKN